MALLSFADSTPRAYRLKVSNACPPISTSTGTSPRTPITGVLYKILVRDGGTVEPGAVLGMIDPV
jgi:biotin carboxyl carrier protein